MCRWKPFIFLAFGRSCLQAVLSHCVKHFVFQCQTFLLTVFLAVNKKHWVSTAVTGLILCFPTAKQNCYCYCERKPEALSDSYEFNCSSWSCSMWWVNFLTRTLTNKSHSSFCQLLLMKPRSIWICCSLMWYYMICHYFNLMCSHANICKQVFILLTRKQILTWWWSMITHCRVRAPQG